MIKATLEAKPASSERHQNHSGSAMKTFVLVALILSLGLLSYMAYDSHNKGRIDKMVWHQANIFCNLSSHNYRAIRVKYNGKTVYAVCSGPNPDPVARTFGVVFDEKESL